MDALNAWLPIAILFLLTTVLAFVVVGLSHLLGPRRPSVRKLMPYESGMTPIGNARLRIRVPFYLVAIEFLLFDVEVIFLVAYALVFRELGLYGLAAAGFFLSVLTIGFIYTLKKGLFTWAVGRRPAQPEAA